MTRSTEAQVSSLIRKELKAAFPSEKFSVSVRNFNVSVFHDVKVEDVSKVFEICQRYELGSTDQTDSYIDHNRDRSIPQVEYVIIQREWK